MSRYVIYGEYPEGESYCFVYCNELNIGLHVRHNLSLETIKNLVTIDLGKMRRHYDESYLLGLEFLNLYGGIYLGLKWADFVGLEIFKEEYSNHCITPIIKLRRVEDV